MENAKKKIINPNEYGSLLFNEKEEDAVKNVLKSKRIFRYSRTEYPYVKMFEEQVKQKFNVNFCLGVSNGTSGLITALKSIEINNNDRVLISSYTFLATALAVKIVGGIPVPIELDLKTGLEIDDLKEEIKKGCKAIIVTQLQGRCFDLSEIRKLIKDKKIYLIEDACQAFGAKNNGKYSGTIGDIGVYSFQQFKQITSGEGGAIVTNNEVLYNRARNYTDMGSVRDRFPSWDSEECLIGQNYRMNNISGALLFEQMNKLKDMIEKQRKSRNNIMDKLRERDVKNIILSEDQDGDTGMNIIITLNENVEADVVIRLALEKNIEIRKMWKGLYFDNELFKKYKLTDYDLKLRECKKTKEIIDKMLVISIPPILNQEDEKDIINMIIFLKNRRYIN